ncbi:hypothetical protein H8M03_07510 [Sphingomonas sabuli]|uniref:Uncharacterized protein n=1 Tax=Sphingomonas sabuli TaxID=2764186 RepID=A0A7G9KZU5_9SPHN|nr:DUF5985 family protein [Sphingomonas sabuli]QNM81894.1 hypothetical protein H8M03_07510 [Sphingomonas sabuli]
MADLFPTIVYTLCFLTSSACAWLLARSYARSGARLLLWSCLCFVLLAASNLLLVVDMLVVPDFDLQLWRLLLAVAAVAVLLFGFIWDLEKE